MALKFNLCIHCGTSCWFIFKVYFKLCQRILRKVHKRAQSQRLPHVLPLEDPGHYLAGLCPKMNILTRRGHQICSLCSHKGGCAGLATPAAWRMAKSPRTCCMESSPPLQTCRKACLSVQACLQTWPEGRQHQPSMLGSCSCRLQSQMREDPWEERRECGQQRSASAPTQPGVDYICSKCNRAYCSRIGLYSHSRHCTPTTGLNHGTELHCLSRQTDANNIKWGPIISQSSDLF